MAERELGILVRARDMASKTLKNVSKEADKLGKTVNRGIGHAGKTLVTLGTVSAGVAAAGLVGAVKAAADFESQMNTINTVARRTPEDLAAIGAGIRQIAKDTGTPLEELTQGFYDLVSAGVDANQAQKVLLASNRLAIGGLASAAEGVDLLTTALNSYGVSAKNQGKESERFADIFAKSIERGKVTAAELAESFAQVGGLAANQGIEIEELAAGYAQLTAKGVPAAEAATQMRAAMIALVRTTGPLEKLQKQTGRNYAAIASKKGLVTAFEQLRKDAKKAGVPMIELVGRQEALQFALNTTGTNLKGYNQNLKEMGNAQGTAAAQMAERQKGLNFQLQRLGALARDAGITIGNKLLPKLTPLFEKAVDFLNTHQGEIESFGDDIADAFEKAAAWASKVPWGQIGEGLKTAAGFAAATVNAFATMPKEAQAAIIALAGLNKLSGGAVGTIVSELSKGLIKGVLGMTAGVVNIKAGIVNGGGGPGPGIPGKGGGGLGNLIKGAPAAIGLAGAASITIAAIAPFALTALTTAIIRGATGKAPSTLANEGHIATGVARGMRADMVPAMNRLPGTFHKPLNEILQDARTGRSRREFHDQRAEQLAARQILKADELKTAQRTAAMMEQRRGERLVQTAQQQKAAIDASKARMSAQLAETRRETTRGLGLTAAAARGTTSAVNRKDLSVTVRSSISISARDTISRLTFVERAHDLG